MLLFIKINLNLSTRHCCGVGNIEETNIEEQEVIGKLVTIVLIYLFNSVHVSSCVKVMCLRLSKIELSVN